MKLNPTYISNLSLKKKIQYIVLICIALLASISLLTMNLIASSYQKVLYQSVAGSLSYSSQELQNSLNNINTMADMFLADPSTQHNLSQLKDSDDPLRRAPASQSLYSILSEYFLNFRKNHIRYMSLYQDQFSTHTYRGAASQHPAAVIEDLLARAREGQGATVWVTDYSEEYGLFMVKEIRRTQHLRLDSLGILIVNVDIGQAIAAATASGRTFEDSDYLLYDKGNLIFDSSGLSEDPAFDIDTSLSDRYGRLQYHGQDCFYVRGTVPGFHWDYVTTIPYGSITDTLTLSRNLCLAMIFTALVLSLILSSRLINSITRHFDNLVIKMQNFGEGNPQPAYPDYNYAARTDELGILHTRFDQMVDEVNELIRSNYLNEILRKEAQLKALETQINPHFLYNTLESINWRAKALGAKDISAMTESLGTLLRITLDQKSKQFPLAKELELIRSYMTIQQFRYEDRLEYRLIVPDELLGCEVLKLTLQPLVENAIRYGLEENTETCFIEIIAEASEQDLYLYVKNNGSSFAEDLLLKLKTHEIKPGGFGIGLLNIHERLQLTYGSNYGLTLYNEEDQAVAKMTFPILWS